MRPKALRCWYYSDVAVFCLMFSFLFPPCRHPSFPRCSAYTARLVHVHASPLDVNGGVGDERVDVEVACEKSCADAAPVLSQPMTAKRDPFVLSKYGPVRRGRRSSSLQPTPAFKPVVAFNFALAGAVASPTQRPGPAPARRAATSTSPEPNMGQTDLPVPTTCSSQPDSPLIPLAVAVGPPLLV